MQEQRCAAVIGITNETIIVQRIEGAIVWIASPAFGSRRPEYPP